MDKTYVLDQIFKRVKVHPSAAVLDVGCGDGKTLVFLKERYQLTGELTGIDKRDKNFISSVEQKEKGIRLMQMDASQTLLFPDESFNVIIHKDTLECIPDIGGHIHELARVLKPGGTVVCVHRDWESIVSNGRNKDLINKAIHGYANFLQAGWMDSCDGWIGRRLWGYFNKTGLFDGEICCYNEIETKYEPGYRGFHYWQEMNHFIEPKGFLTKEEYGELIEDMEETWKNGTYIFASPFYFYIGKKRGS